MKFWFDTLKSRLLLTFVTYVLYMLLYLLTDELAREFYFGGYSVWVYLADVVGTLLFTFFIVQLSIFYSRFIYKRFFFHDKPYRDLIVYSVVLLLLNNLTACLLTFLTGYLLEIDELPFMRIQHLYVYGILAAFISSIYTNAWYLYGYMEAEAEKKRLEVVAIQAQLAALKQQIDPHFMFNNFSILSELIMEDRQLAVKFLDKLSKVYRYVIQNYARDLVTLADELNFLDAYLYLMGIRYEDAIVVDISPELRKADGCVPPVCLQLLVENALKHNRFSVDHPLKISLTCDGEDVVVVNNLQPLASDVHSTGVGQRNIVGRYALLGNRRPTVEKTEDAYTVRLPILPHKEGGVDL